MRLWALILSIAVIFGATPAPAAQSLGGFSQRRVAILEFQNISRDKEFSWLGLAVPETLTTKLNAVRSISLIERSQINKILKEQEFAVSDLADPKKVVKLGRLAGAQLIVIGSFLRFQDRILFNLRFVDVETSVILHTAQARGATGDADKLFDSLNSLADAAIEALNKRVVIRAGETRVARAAPAERIAPTAKERKRLYKAPAASLTAFALYGKGLEAQKKFHWDEAIRFFRQAIEKDPDYADALNALGVVLDDKGRWGEALRNYTRALAIYRKKGDEKWEAGALNNIGIIHDMQGRYALAMEFHEKSLAIEKRLGNQAGMAKTLNNIGSIHWRQGRYTRAMEFFEKSLTINKRLGDQAGMAATLGNIGTIHKNQGRYARAMEFYEKSLAIKKRLGDRSGIAFSLYNMGALANEQRNLGLAIRYMEKARDIFRSLGSPHVKVAEKNLRIFRRKAGR